MLLEDKMCLVKINTTLMYYIKTFIYICSRNLLLSDDEPLKHRTIRHQGSELYGQ